MAQNVLLPSRCVEYAFSMIFIVLTACCLGEWEESLENEMDMSFRTRCMSLYV